MAKLEPEDNILDFVGPLGRPSDLTVTDIDELKKKKILFVAGGVGLAPVYPQVKLLYENRILSDVLFGCKSKEHIFFEEEIKAISSNLYIATDDGSYGYKGLVTELLKDLIKQRKKTYDLIVVIGPLIMMKSVAQLTKEYGIKTIVSMNPIMVDGTGMCGGCRVSVGGETKFTCVDGPEFDAHLVDYDEAMRRLNFYKTEEGIKMIRTQVKDLDQCPACPCKKWN